MKKFVFFLSLAVLLLLCAAGCAPSDSQAEEPSPSPLEELDAAAIVKKYHETNIEIIAHDLNENPMAQQLSYILESDTELRSIQFLDLSFAEKGPAEGRNSNFVIRYLFAYDEKEGVQSLYTKYYEISPEMMKDLKWNFTSYEYLPAMVEYMYQNSDGITDNGKYALCLNPLEKDLEIPYSGFFAIDAYSFYDLIESSQDSE